MPTGNRKPRPDTKADKLRAGMTRKREKRSDEGMAVPPKPERQRVSDEAARRFSEPEKPRATPRESALRRTERGERLTVYLPPELEAEFRVYCAQRKWSHSHGVTEALRLLLESTSA